MSTNAAAGTQAAEQLTFEPRTARFLMDRRYVTAALMLVMVLGTFMIVPFIAPYLEANCGIARTSLPMIYFVGGICTLVAMNFIGWLTDRFGARPVFIIAASSALVLTVIITNLPPISLPIAILAITAFMCAASSRVVPARPASGSTPS